MIRQYRPRYIMENGIPDVSWSYGPFVRAAASATAERLPPTRRTLSLGDARLHVLPPPGDTAWGQNDNSIGLIVELGDFRAVARTAAPPGGVRR